MIGANVPGGAIPSFFDSREEEHAYCIGHNGAMASLAQMAQGRPRPGSATRQFTPAGRDPRRFTDNPFGEDFQYRNLSQELTGVNIAVHLATTAYIQFNHVNHALTSGLITYNGGVWGPRSWKGPGNPPVIDGITQEQWRLFDCMNHSSYKDVPRHLNPLSPDVVMRLSYTREVFLKAYFKDAYVDPQTRANSTARACAASHGAMRRSSSRP